jgi:hypothetical protein
MSALFILFGLCVAISVACADQPTTVAAPIAMTREACATKLIEFTRRYPDYSFFCEAQPPLHLAVASAVPS